MRIPINLRHDTRQQYRLRSESCAPMPLDFTEFAHHYQGHGLSDLQQRAHFDTFADLMDCIARLFWRDGTDRNVLGITLDVGSLQTGDTVDSRPSITFSFNGAASVETAGKKDS